MRNPEIAMTECVIVAGISSSQKIKERCAEICTSLNDVENLFLLLTVVGVCAVLAQIMLIQKLLLHRLKSRIQRKGIECHLCALL